MKKEKVAIGLLSEMIIITVICLTVGLGTGAIVSQPISDILLKEQVAASETQNQNNNFGNRGGGGMVLAIGGSVLNSRGSNVEALTEMKVGMSVVTVAEIILISLLLAGVASAAGIMHVTKYEPMRILSERT